MSEEVKLNVQEVLDKAELDAEQHECLVDEVERKAGELLSRIEIIEQALRDAALIHTFK